MSINSVQSDPYTQAHSLYQNGSRSGGNTVGNDFSPPPSNGTQGNVSGTGGTNPFASIASDIQAILVQAQASASQGTASASASSTSGTSGSSDSTGTTAASSPEQDLINQIQSLISNIQGGGQSSTSQTASTDPSGPVGAAGGHHHHHHHHGGQDSTSASTAIASSQGTDTTSSGTTDSSLAQSLAGDIVRALQSYAGAGQSATAGSASTTVATG